MNLFYISGVLLAFVGNVCATHDTVCAAAIWDGNKPENCKLLLNDGNATTTSDINGNDNSQIAWLKEMMGQLVESNSRQQPPAKTTDRVISTDTCPSSFENTREGCLYVEDG